MPSCRWRTGCGGFREHRDREEERVDAVLVLHGLGLELHPFDEGDELLLAGHRDDEHDEGFLEIIAKDAVGRERSIDVDPLEALLAEPVLDAAIELLDHLLAFVRPADLAYDFAEVRKEPRERLGLRDERRLRRLRAERCRDEQDAPPAR